MVSEFLAIGIDVGGTKIAGGLVGFPSGEVLVREQVPTRAERGPEAVLSDVAELVHRLTERARAAQRALVGIGLGVPELVDLEGRITSAQTIDWRQTALADRLGAAVPVWIEADVRAAALGEARFGAGRDFRLFLYVTVGTGISSTLVLDGRPHAGARGNALVLASGPQTWFCPDCGARVTATLEDVASGPALVRQYAREGSLEAATAEQVLAAARAGDAAAIGIVEQAGAALGSSVALLVNVLDPEAVVVGGGLGLAGGIYGRAFVEAARSAIWAPQTRDLPILPAGLGTEAGLIGAAALAWQRCTEGEFVR